MLDAIDAIMRHTTRGRAVLDDEVTGAAVMHWVEIIGEAAGRVSSELRTTYQEIPWVGAISMRNRLVHGYFEIDADRVWDAVTTELPTLRDQLRAILDKLLQAPAP